MSEAQPPAVEPVHELARSEAQEGEYSPNDRQTAAEFNARMSELSLKLRDAAAHAALAAKQLDVGRLAHAVKRLAEAIHDHLVPAKK
ncbi:MAG TPA: hypothetical protein VNE67_08945 [Acetobacteraceae bacterium]|nr:hypothetical protein [Acetobacteraceae bacterium]